MTTLSARFGSNDPWVSIRFDGILIFVSSNSFFKCVLLSTLHLSTLSGSLLRACMKWGIVLPAHVIIMWFLEICPLPTDSWYWFRSAKVRLFPWIPLRPLSIFLRQFWDIVHEQEALYINPDALCRLRECSYLDLVKCSIEMILFFLVYIHVKGLCYVNPIYIQDRDIWEQKSYPWEWR